VPEIFDLPPAVERTLRDGIAAELPRLAELLAVEGLEAELQEALLGLGAQFWLCHKLRGDAPSRGAHRRRLERLRDHLDGALTEVVEMLDHDRAAFDALRPALGAVEPMAELHQAALAALDRLGPAKGDHAAAADAPLDWLVTAASVLWIDATGRPATRTAAFLEYVEAVHLAVTGEAVSLQKRVQRHFQKGKGPT
jgi:hypothetical protein